MRRQAMATWIIVIAAIATLAAADDLRLVEAVKQGNRDAVRRMLTRRVDPNAKEADGSSALHWAVQANDEELVDLLIRAGASATAATEYSVTPISLAAANGNAVVIAALLKAGADPNLDAGRRDGPHDRRADRQSGAITLLLERGADVNAADGWQGRTP